jgi:DNA-binding FrmR family transcriptional regulator
MLAERVDCQQIVQQMAAARGALDRAMVQLMVGSMTECLRARDGTIDEHELRRLGERFAKLL